MDRFQFGFPLIGSKTETFDNDVQSYQPKTGLFEYESC